MVVAEIPARWLANDEFELSHTQSSIAEARDTDTAKYIDIVQELSARRVGVGGDRVPHIIPIKL